MSVGGRQLGTSWGLPRDPAKRLKGNRSRGKWAGGSNSFEKLRDCTTLDAHYSNVYWAVVSAMWAWHYHTLWTRIIISSITLLKLSFTTVFAGLLCGTTINNCNTRRRTQCSREMPHNSANVNGKSEFILLQYRRRDNIQFYLANMLRNAQSLIMNPLSLPWEHQFLIRKRQR